MLILILIIQPQIKQVPILDEFKEDGSYMFPCRTHSNLIAEVGAVLHAGFGELGARCKGDRSLCGEEGVVVGEEGLWVQLEQRLSGLETVQVEDVGRVVGGMRVANGW